MKKWVILFILIFICYFSASAQEIFKSGEYQYTLLEDGTAEIIKYEGKKTKINIPDNLDGHKVSSIGDEAFYFCWRLTDVSIPESVNKIGNDAFHFCKGITRIMIPYGVTEIGDGAFSFCEGLERINLPNTLIHIGNDAFHCCEHLRDISIPSSVVSIGSRAFESCNSLKNIVIPDSTISIGIEPFVGCQELLAIHVSPDNPEFASVGGVLFRKSNKSLICYPIGKSESNYSIPKGITEIGKDAFYDCKRLTNISMPSTLIKIGDYAFESCEGLISIMIPESIRDIGRNPFYDCKALQTIQVSPNNPEFEVINGALLQKNNRKLISYPAGKNAMSYTIPLGVVEIADYSFCGCDYLESIIIPEGVTQIDEGVFYDCKNLSKVVIPDSVTRISSAFTFYGNRDDLMITVSRDSYAMQYCKELGINYNYPDSLDWLNN